MTSFEQILYDVADGVATVTLNRPDKLNAWTGQMEKEVQAAATEAALIGAGINLPNANRAYYRVVAVDEKGNRSGPSDFAEAPRPLLWSCPVTAAKVGSEYHYALAAIRSVGVTVHSLSKLLVLG